MCDSPFFPALIGLLSRFNPFRFLFSAYCLTRSELFRPAINDLCLDIRPLILESCYCTFASLDCLTVYELCSVTTTSLWIIPIVSCSPVYVLLLCCTTNWITTENVLLETELN